MVSFVGKILHDLELAQSAEGRLMGLTPSHVGSAANLRKLARLTAHRRWRHLLVGPAEQDLLFDSLMSILYDRPRCGLV